VEEDEYGIRSTVPAPTDENLELRLKTLGKCNTVGKDEIPIEVFAASKVAKGVLFDLIRRCWDEEGVPIDAVIGVVVTIFKRKGSSQDFSKYRFICLLNHAFKLMSCYCCWTPSPFCAEACTVDWRHQDYPY
jgi:hypothetical protein